MIGSTLDGCAAVVVAHARVDLARVCVRSLAQSLPLERIVVVLNVPHEVDPADAAALAREATLISPPEPRGYGANLNFGVAALPSGLTTCILANDDVVFGAKSLPRLLDVLEADPSVGLVGPQFVDETGHERKSFAAFPSVAEVVENAGVLPRPLWQAAARRRAREAAATEKGVGFPVGAALLVRLAAFEAVRGFDEDFFLNWEEADFAYRLRRAGWGVTTCPGSIVGHLQGESIDRALNFDSYFASLRLFFRKRLGPSRWTLLELLLITVFLTSAAYESVASLLRPRTARHRGELIRERWRCRIFLRSSQPVRKP